MAFSEKIKSSVKEKANFICCFCEKRSRLDIHHIIPQAEGGSDDEDNAAPLCGRCHNDYGNNPDFRKTIRQKRDHWYERCSRDYNQRINSDAYVNSYEAQNNDPLSVGVISSHAGPGGWNQGDPLSPFHFVVKLDLANHSSKPVILKKFKISAINTSYEKLNQGQPQGTLLFVKNGNKIPVNIFPYQIPGEYFGLMEYQIKIQLDDQNRLKFDSDSMQFQNYEIELSYEYYGVDRTVHNNLIAVQDDFQEFKKDWLEVWTQYVHRTSFMGLEKKL